MILYSTKELNYLPIYFITALKETKEPIHTNLKKNED